MNDKYDIITDNYGIIIDFCKNNYEYHNVQFDTLEDMISILTLEILENIDKYDSEKGKVSTFFWWIMSNKVNDYYKSVERHWKENTVTVEFDNGKVDYSMLDFYPSDYNLVNELIKKESLENILPLLDTVTKEYYLNNKLMREIAEENKVTIQAISKRIIKNINDIKRILIKKGEIR